MIPQSAAFEQLLSSITAFAPEEMDGWRRLIVIPASTAIGVNGAMAVPERALWFQPSETISIDALIAKIEKELIARGHKANRDIAMSVLGLFALHRNPREGSVVEINRLLGLAVEVQVSQTFLLPPINWPSFSLELTPFRFQLLDSTRLKYRCEKAGSDFFELYGQQLRGRMSIERNLFPKIIVDWSRDDVHVLKQRWPIKTFRDAYQSHIDNYFEAISRELQNDFWSNFLEAQHLFIAAGAPYLDERELSRLLPSQMITIFSGLGPTNKGFVFPLTAGQLRIEFAQAHLRIPKVGKMLSDDFGMGEFTNSEVHQTLKTYCKFMSRAERHMCDGRPDEAFLHFVISLDLVFGEKDASTKSISHRVAFITHHAMGRGLDEQIKRLNAIYDRRSRYVHAGEKIPETMIDEVQSVCREVLWCLLRFQKVGAREAPVSAWLTTLDYLVAATEANRPIDASELRECGIAL
jgi:hypothetical protein